MTASYLTSEKPFVSVLMLVYNHEKYLRLAIESVMQQKTTFPFELIIHDDASTDGSAEIIKEYAEKYPNQIVPVFQMENQYQKDTNIILNNQLPRAKGNIYAFCEGDDFWINDQKLQIQVDYLCDASNRDCVAVYHNCVMVDDDGSITDAPKKIYRTLPASDYSMFRFATDEVYPGQLASLMIRASVFNVSADTYHALKKIKTRGEDSKILLLALCRGRVHVLAECMSAHRVSYGNGSYTSRTFGRNMSGIFFVSQIDFRIFVRRSFNKHLINHFKVFHAGIAVIAKYMLNPCAENCEALNYAKASTGGAIRFLAQIIWSGLIGLPVEIIRITLGRLSLSGK